MLKTHKLKRYAKTFNRSLEKSTYLRMTMKCMSYWNIHCLVANE